MTKKRIMLLTLITVAFVFLYAIDTYNIVLVKPIAVSTAFDEDGSTWACPSASVTGKVFVRENGESYMRLSGMPIEGTVELQLLDFQTVGLWVSGEEIGIARAAYRKRFGKVKRFILSGISLKTTQYADAFDARYVFARQ